MKKIFPQYSHGALKNIMNLRLQTRLDSQPPTFQEYINIFLEGGWCETNLV